MPEGQNADIGTPIALLDDGTGGPAPVRRHETAPPCARTGAAVSGPARVSSIPAQSGPTAPPRLLPAARRPLPRTPRPAAAAQAARPRTGTANGRAGDGGANGTARQVASPLVRKLARENHLDLSHVTGSGPGGRIIRADISGLLAGGAPGARLPRPDAGPAAAPAAAAARRRPAPAAAAAPRTAPVGRGQPPGRGAARPGVAGDGAGRARAVSGRRRGARHA